MKKGPDSTAKVEYAFSGKGHYWQAYGEGNQLPAESKGIFEAPEGVVISRPHPFAPVSTHSAAEAYRLVLAQGGATKPVRDRITTYVAQTVEDGTGFVPNTPEDWPYRGFDSYPPAAATPDENGNGMPDEWEIARGLNPATTKPNGRELNPHYDNIEVYLNSI